MLFTMKDVECLTGIKAYTIRTWEKRYSFLKPARTLTNIRSYNTKEVIKILSIALLNKYGNKTSQLVNLPEEKLLDKIVNLENPKATEDRIIFNLIQKMLSHDAEAFENILHEYELNLPDQIISLVLVPFFERIEILWQTGTITPVQNYFVSNIMRQYLYSAIQKLSFTKTKDQKSGCLFLPHKENQDLGLLCTAYLLKSKGIHIIYLGGIMPLIDVEYVVKKMSPNFMYVHFCAANSINFSKFLSDINKRFKIPLIISGNLGLVFQKKIPANIIFKKKINEVMTFLP